MFPHGTHTTEKGNSECDSTDDTDDDEGVKDEVHGVRDDLLVVCQLPRADGYRPESA